MRGRTVLALGLLGLLAPSLGSAQAAPLRVPGAGSAPDGGLVDDGRAGFDGGLIRDLPSGPEGGFVRTLTSAPDGAFVRDLPSLLDGRLIRELPSGPDLGPAHDPRSGPDLRAVPDLRFLSQEAQADSASGGLTFLGTAKWAALAVSAGSAVYGFSLNSQADDLFGLLEGLCDDDPDRCDPRNPDGSFQDEDLEGLYQDTLDKDRQARTALIVSQVSLAASVLFFIMDLSNADPPDIPFDPSFRVGGGPWGGRWSGGPWSDRWSGRPWSGGRIELGARIGVGPGRSER